eukprot:3031591-Rhodomonas_salina.1
MRRPVQVHSDGGVASAGATRLRHRDWQAPPLALAHARCGTQTRRRTSTLAPTSGLKHTVAVTVARRDSETTRSVHNFECTQAGPGTTPVRLSDSDSARGSSHLSLS